MFKCPFEGEKCSGDYLGQDGLCDADTLPIWEYQEQECKDAKQRALDNKKDIDNRVKSVIAEQLGVRIEKVVPESNLKEDLGADSLDAIELTMRIEDEFSMEIPDEEANKLTTVKDIILYVTAKVEGA